MFIISMDGMFDEHSRIFTNWNDKYMIGYHNGPYPYSYIGDEEWKDIIIHHHYTHIRGTNNV